MENAFELALLHRLDVCVQAATLLLLLVPLQLSFLLIRLKFVKHLQAAHRIIFP